MATRARAATVERVARMWPGPRALRAGRRPAARSSALADAPRHDAIGMDSDHRLRIGERFGAPADLDAARSPWIDAGQVVDHDGGAPRSPHVAVLLRALELTPADVDGVGLRVVAPPDRRHVWR